MLVSADRHGMSLPAFDPAAISHGALLPEDARQRLTSLRGLPDGAVRAVSDGWAAPYIPVLVRGEARIIPLAWWGARDAPYNAAAEATQIDRFASSVRSAFSYMAGNWSTLDDVSSQSDGHDSIASYVRALRAAGGTHADVWRRDHDTGVALVHAGEREAGTASLALHIVPSAWVSSPAPYVSRRDLRSWRPVVAIDLTWSWSDVVHLHAQRMNVLGDVDVSDVISRYLKGYPQINDPSFREGFESSAVCGAARIVVDEILLETMRIQPNWDQPLADIGDEVAATMRDRHPELSEEAARRLGNYFTYQVK